jgi:hypothetical protein
MTTPAYRAITAAVEALGAKLTPMVADLLAQTQRQAAVIQAQADRIAALEKAVREIPLPQGIHVTGDLTQGRDTLEIKGELTLTTAATATPTTTR